MTAPTDQRAPGAAPSRALAPGRSPPESHVVPVVAPSPPRADGGRAEDDRRALARARAGDGLEQALAEAPVGDLVVGIAHESRQILGKYIELLKLDLHRELLDVRAAVLFTTLTIAFGAVGLILLGFAASAWVAGELGWPVAAARGIVGTAILMMSAAAWWLAARRVREVEVPQAVSEAKEDAEWIRDNV